jgi:hypothetical protein
MLTKKRGAQADIVPRRVRLLGAAPSIPESADNPLIAGIMEDGHDIES